MNIIGYLGKDCVHQIHGTESVLNFSVAHTDKYKNSDGTQYQKTTWVNCSWWVERTAVAQYLKQGTLVYVEGIPEAKHYTKNGETKSYLNMRVYRVELLAGKREDNSSQQQSGPASGDPQPGYQAVNTGDDDLPF